MEAAEGFLVDFPTIADVGEAWVKRHCVIPDKQHRGEPFEWSDWQFWCAANYYRIRPGLASVIYPYALSRYYDAVIVNSRVVAPTPLPTMSGVRVPFEQAWSTAPVSVSAARRSPC